MSQKSNQIYDVIIIGGGPAGYSAALYACRSGLKTMIFEKEIIGGQMSATTHIDNYPGFSNGIDGFSLSNKMKEQAEAFGTITCMEEVTKVSLYDTPKYIYTPKGSYACRAVIIATGARPKHLDLPNEDSYIGQGIHYCASCDGMFYKDKTVMVIGGGDSAVTEALLLSKIAKQVYLVHRRTTLRASKIYQKQLHAAQNIEFIPSHLASAVEKQENGMRITLKNTEGNLEREFFCDGIFVSIGHYPATELFRGILDLEDSGYIKANESTCTHIPGVFAAGDVRTKPMRQILTAAADGAVAAKHAEEYIGGLCTAKDSE